VSVLVEDSPRNLLAWIQHAIDRDVARGAVLTPFATPCVNRPGAGGRRGVHEVAQGLRDSQGEIWFDAETHALQMAGVGDWRYYDEYDLWPGSRGDLSTPEARAGHVRLVFAMQDRVGAPHLAPTILLHHGESGTSQQALDLAAAAVERDPACWLSVAGTSPFWSSGSALDAHIGALAQLEPAGWFLTVARPLHSLPVEADVEEVHGLCRSTRALAENAPVHVSHGDLAALPAVAAGAYSVGSGWDQRQRVCAFGNYGARDPNSSSSGSWYQRPTFHGLLGSLKIGEAEVLQNRDPALALRLGPPPPPGVEEAYLHHLTVLHGLVEGLSRVAGYEERCRALADRYADAANEWPGVVRLTSSSLGSADWVDVLAAGLGRYARSEGW
jgi:hypothetical protein